MSFIDHDAMRQTGRSPDGGYHRQERMQVIDFLLVGHVRQVDHRAHIGVAKGARDVGEFVEAGPRLQRSPRLEATPAFGNPLRGQ